ncbi:MAG TPA: DUF4034 domain-containing protein [Trebonia sp.]|nr:DUF4034 domain-containing protein [Trebonia sp.]
MALFKKKPVSARASAAATGQPRSVPIPKLRGDERALAFEAQLARGQWQEFHDFLAATASPGMRGFYLTQLSAISGRPQWLDEWVAARPESALPLLFRGLHSRHWAWEARGSGRAHTVKEDAWPLFHARLVEADRDLAAAAALDDRDPVSAAESLPVAMGLSLGQVEVRRRFDEAYRRYPLNGGACVNMIHATARKWGGSHEAMFEFARWASGQAPDGHPVHKVVALAHIEMWLDSAKGEAQQGYFRSQAVKDEVMAAAQRSILSPNYAPEGIPLSWADRGVFAFCFRLMREYAAQLDQMRLIGPYVVAFPWSYQGKAGVKYEAHRQHAFKELYGVVGPPWEAFLASAGWNPAALSGGQETE